MSEQPGPAKPVPDQDRAEDPVVDLDRVGDVEIDLTAFLPEGVVIDARGDEPRSSAADEVAGGADPEPHVSVDAPPPGQDGLVEQSAEQPAEQDEVDVALLDAVERDLEAVEAALRSLDDGTYGTCAVCRAVLDVHVLAADPVRRTCPEHA